MRRDVILARHHHFLFIRFARATLLDARRDAFELLHRLVLLRGELSAALLRVSDVLHERVHAFDVFLEHLGVHAPRRLLLRLHLGDVREVVPPNRRGIVLFDVFDFRRRRANRRVDPGRALDERIGDDRTFRGSGFRGVDRRRERLLLRLDERLVLLRLFYGVDSVGDLVLRRRQRLRVRGDDVLVRRVSLERLHVGRQLGEFSLLRRLRAIVRASFATRRARVLPRVPLHPLELGERVGVRGLRESVGVRGLRVRGLRTLTDHGAIARVEGVVSSDASSDADASRRAFLASRRAILASIFAHAGAFLAGGDASLDSDALTVHRLGRGARGASFLLTLLGESFVFFFARGASRFDARRLSRGGVSRELDGSEARLVGIDGGSDESDGGARGGARLAPGLGEAAVDHVPEIVAGVEGERVAGGTRARDDTRRAQGGEGGSSAETRARDGRDRAHGQRGAEGGHARGRASSTTSVTGGGLGPEEGGELGVRGGGHGASIRPEGATPAATRRESKPNENRDAARSAGGSLETKGRDDEKPRARGGLEADARRSCRRRTAPAR